MRFAARLASNSRTAEAPTPTPTLLLLACAMLVSACAAGDPGGVPASAESPAAEPPTPAAFSVTPANRVSAITPVVREPGVEPATERSAATPVAVEVAVQRAGGKLLGDALGSLGSAPRELVIDPLIDANTGQQTVTSVSTGIQLARLVAERFPMWKVQPLTRKVLSNAPLLLIGTLTPVDLNDAGSGAPDAYRIWLTLADLRTGRIVAKRLDRATPTSVNAEPTRYFRDSPTWHKDRTVRAYINSCQIDARIGDPLDPLYLMRLPAAALLHEAIDAYNDNRLALAHRLYGDAARLAETDDLRVLNGRYLTSWRLGKKREANEAFSRIVANGLAAKRLALKVLFEPGGTTMLEQADLRTQYRLWLREVAKQANAQRNCLRVVGHSSHTGTAAASEELSLRRAAVVRWILAREAPPSTKRFSAEGVGWRENLIGLGTDDLRDALDRRVEIRVIDCP